MKNNIILLIFTIVMVQCLNAQAQNPAIDSLNPINFTVIKQRNPASNGKASITILSNSANVHFIQKEGTLQLEFDRSFVESLKKKDQLDLRIKALIKRKDKSIKPLTVLGYTNVQETEKPTTEKILNGDNDSNSLITAYKVDYIADQVRAYSAEVVIAFEEVSNDDQIILQITNEKVHSVGFVTTFKFFEYGWNQEPTGGFAFVKTFGNNFGSFNAAGFAGVAFKYDTKPSSRFIYKFINPSFGPEVSVLQNDLNKTLIGTGVFVTELMRTVKFGAGLFINDGQGKGYFSIGLNFVEGYKTINGLVNKTK